MMDHIINFDWNYREPEEYFIRPEDLDNSVTERILRNKFRDPLISSDEEGDDNRPCKVNWNEIIERQNKRQWNRVFVPGLMKPPLYLKLSALTFQQHRQCLKVLSAQEPHVLPAIFLQRPTKMDLQTMEEVRETYEKEQKEFIDWAKVLWATDHCRRVLRPKPRVEALYEAHFKITAHEMQTFPKSLRLAAQIPLESTNGSQFEIVHQKDLITINIEELPEVECPMNIQGKLSIMKPMAIPEPCPQHPCKFILPTESTITEKPLVEVYRSLAQYAVENGASCIASENAFACLLEQDRAWMLPLAIVDTFGSDGEPCNVIVLGQEFDNLKQTAPVRNYRAFKHMLDVALVRDTQIDKLRYSNIKALQRVNQDKNTSNRSSFGMPSDDVSSDDEDAMMIIDTGTDDDMPLSSVSSPKRSNGRVTRANPRCSPRINKDLDSSLAKSPDKNNRRSSGNMCTCKDSLQQNPPPRSYRKWRLSNKTCNDHIDVVVHCAHKLKVKDKSNELLLEPIPEYQLELGASQQQEGRTRSLELALMLRRNATLANVRVNGTNGDIVRVDCYSEREFGQRHGRHGPRLANALHSALDQLRGLLPGHYVLEHDPSHGSNALLFATKGRSSEQRSLQFDHTTLVAADESLSVRTPPQLIPLLLPVHKHRTILPLAFTHNQKEVIQETKKPVTRAKPPPQALQLANGVETSAKTQWPKKRGKKRKRRN